MNLRSTQKNFSDALIKNSNFVNEKFCRIVRNNPRIPEKLALEIYRNNSRGVQVEALRSIYPVLEKIVGEQCFNQLAYDYVQVFPSTHSDLNGYGEHYAEFIKTAMQSNKALAELLYLYDLARLEWCYHAAYYAADDVNDITGLQNDPAQSIIKPASSLALMHSDYPVYEIWQAHKQAINMSDIASLEQTEYLVIYRRGLQPDIVRISYQDWQLLTAISKAITMAELAEYSQRHDLPMQKSLPTMFAQGWIYVA